MIQKPWTVGSFLWTFAFVLVVLVATLGNSIVLWIVLGIHIDFGVDSYSYLLIISADSSSRNVEYHKLLPSESDNCRPTDGNHELLSIVSFHERQVGK